MKVCIVSSCGGHLTEMRLLSSAYKSVAHFYVLNDRIDLSADMKDRTYFIRHAERDWRTLVNFAEAWQILRAERPSVILSAGAGPVVPFSVVGRLLGIPTVFVETFGRVYAPSLTGRVMYRLATRFFYQWPSLEGFFPRGAFAGSVLGGTKVGPRVQPRGDSLFVTVGNLRKPFSRLLSAVDELAGQGRLPFTRVVMQSGHSSTFQARHCQQRPFLSPTAFTDEVRRAGIIVCHAGAGTILHALEAGLVPVVMPRRLEHGEHIDDHQLDLARSLNRTGLVVVANEPSQIEAAIVRAARLMALPGGDRDSLSRQVEEAMVAVS